MPNRKAKRERDQPVNDVSKREEGPKLVVHAKDGTDVAIMLADKFRAIAVVKSSMADIKQGTFIGTATATQPDSTLRSLEVVVFLIA